MEIFSIINSVKVEIIKNGCYVITEQNYLNVVRNLTRLLAVRAQSCTNAGRVAVINAGVDRTFFIGPYGSAFAAGTAEGNGRTF